MTELQSTVLKAKTVKTTQLSIDVNQQVFPQVMLILYVILILLSQTIID